MILELDNLPTVALTGSRDGQSPLVLVHQNDDLADFEHTMMDELTAPTTTAELIIPDFQHSGTTYEVHAWEEEEPGEFSDPWPRANGRVSSGPRSKMDAIVLLVAVPSGVTAPEPEPINGPPGPDQAVIKVKVGPKGSMPF